MNSEVARFAVLGAGSFGTALATLLTRNGHATTLWGRDAAVIESCRASGRNSRFLPDVDLPGNLGFTTSIEDAVKQSTHVLIAIPSHAFRPVLERTRPLGIADKCLVWATKGFEPGTGRLLHEVVAELLGPGVGGAVLSGPTFAAEVAAGLPTAVTVGAALQSTADRVASCFHNSHFRVYTSTDLVGVQVGGGVKNVFALAAGIADGLGFGANTRAALITRGLSELMRLGVALGARSETLMGLAGVGDLVLTCTDDKSRNRRAGLLLGKGAGASELEAEIGQVVEGVGAAREVIRLARRLEVEMPIAEQVNAVLYAGTQPEEAVRTLLGRSAKAEL